MSKQVKPQEIFKPLHMLMPVETAAGILQISVDDLIRSIEAGQRKKLQLIEMPEGKYIEYLGEHERKKVDVQETVRG